MSEFFKGPLSKMSTLRTSAGQVEYSLSLGEANIALNDYLGQPITLMHTGKLYCIACGREVKKTFQQGYCFVCTQKLAECDTCLIKPERCHYHLGTCREPSWGEQHCLKDHYVYLANASGLKVGITRLT
ncbi:MAG: DUF2797 domain-containing protein, partial [Gammaproteobacteria bacterium]|nr:DUF2797 domain-containing protein [Gammaproteobacteria bacterium]